MVPENLKYTKTHEWVRIEDGKAVTGITDHAQDSLGDITFVELPEKGADVQKGGELATVESVKAASDIYSPVSGKIKEVNDKLENEPEIINSSPYEEGWITEIVEFSESDLSDLMDFKAYSAFLEENE